MHILGIDPSNTRHAWALIEQSSDDAKPALVGSGRDVKEWGDLPSLVRATDLIAVEMIASYGMAVGAHTFDTCVEIGRLLEKLDQMGREVQRITRVEVKRIVCRAANAKDANVRAACIDRFGGPAAIKKGGALYGVAGDTWAALAVALAAASGEARWYTPVADKEAFE